MPAQVRTFGQGVLTTKAEGGTFRTSGGEETTLELEDSNAPRTVHGERDGVCVCE